MFVVSRARLIKVILTTFLICYLVLVLEAKSKRKLSCVNGLFDAVTGDCVCTGRWFGNRCQFARKRLVFFSLFHTLNMNNISFNLVGISHNGYYERILYVIVILQSRKSLPSVINGGRLGTINFQGDKMYVARKYVHIFAFGRSALYLKCFIVMPYNLTMFCRLINSTKKSFSKGN